jgi:hypothetical protein
MQVQFYKLIKSALFQFPAFLFFLIVCPQLSKAQENPQTQKENCPATSENTSTKIEFDGSIRFGLRSFFGEKKGDRVHEALARLDTQFTIDKDFRVSLGGETGYAKNVEDLASRQNETDRYSAYLRTDISTFGNSLADFESGKSDENVFGWALDVRRVENDFNGTRERNSLAVLPFVINGGSHSRGEWCSANFGAGVKYEEAAFDTEFLNSIGTPADSTQNFAGLYCEANFSIMDMLDNKTPGVGFDAYWSMFFDGVSNLQTWKLGAELSKPLLRESNCRIALSWSVEDNDDPSGQSQFVGVFGIIPIGGKPSYPKRLY